MEEQLTASIGNRRDQSDVWRLQAIFFEPVRTFESIALRPSFWLPLVLSIVVGLLLWQALAYLVDLEAVLIEQAKSAPQMARLTDEQIEQQMGLMIPMIKWVAPIAAPPLMVFGLAGLILLLVHLSGSQTTYHKLLGVTAHSLFFQTVVGSLLMVLVYALASDPTAIDLENPVLTNLGPLVEAKESPVLHRLATSVDLIVWYVIYLLGMGTAAVSKRMSVRKGVVLVAIPYAIYVLITVVGRAILT